MDSIRSTQVISSLGIPAGFRRRPPRGLLVAAFALCLWVPLAGAQTVSNKVAYTDWYPYTFSEESRATGFEIEIADAVFRSLGIQAAFIELPWRRCIESLEAGAVDAVVSMLDSDERRAYAIFPDESISSSVVMVTTLRDSSLQYEGHLSALDGHTVGVIDGFVYGGAFDRAPGIVKDTSRGPSMLLDKLMQGRNDAVIENRIVLSAYAAEAGVLYRLRFLEPPIVAQRLYLCFSRARGLEALDAAFSSELAAFKRTDAYAAILARYGLTPEAMGNP